MADRLKKIRRQDPRMLYPVSFDLGNLDMYQAWAYGFGTVLRPFSSGFYCGNNVHPIVGATVGGIEADPDTELGRYFLLVGSQVGSVVNYFTMGAASSIARKRPGDVKIVVVDPVCSYAAGKAEEWIPIRPGTDAAFLLGLVNQLINVLNIYDEPYLKHRTNAPYLVSKDGKYVKLNGKPLVYDRRNGFVTYDKASEPVLIGRFEYGDVECMPAFQHLKEHVKKYSPEYVSEITSIPPETVIRIAEEYGKAANIGGFIEIKGRKLPYRPASTHWYRGLSAHKHSFISGMAAMLLNVIVGNIDVPGGLLGAHRFKTYATEEGLLAAIPGRTIVINTAYPPRKASLPKSIDLFDLTPVACYSRPFFIWGVMRPKEFKTPYNIDTMLVVRCNPVKTALSRKLMEGVMSKIPYLISITTEVDETAEFADLVFPDLHSLERLAISFSFDRSGLPRIFYGQKPAVTFPYTTPWPRYINNAQILLEVADRAGFLGDVYKALNFVWDLKEPYKLDPNKRYSFEELVDRCLKNLLGEDKGIEWYLNNGLYIEDIPVEEMYRGLSGRKEYKYTMSSCYMPRMI
jgi:anaerobic selenocysteine-containing dehydrogenase